MFQRFNNNHRLGFIQETATPAPQAQPAPSTNANASPGWLSGVGTGTRSGTPFLGMYDDNSGIGAHRSTESEPAPATRERSATEYSNDPAYLPPVPAPVPVPAPIPVAPVPAVAPTPAPAPAPRPRAATFYANDPNAT